MYTDLSIHKILNFRGAVLYNGGVRRLQRHGLKANGVYGKVDNLHIKYDGNRISTVLEDAADVTQNGSMDYPGGNNRAVINGSTGAIEQTIAYYPYGGVIADLGTPTTGQPYKFGGKELITANGLNEYDFGARRYYQAVPHFTSIDPMAEKYPWLSPYLYCANNPVNAIDPDGNIIIFLNGMHKGDGGKSDYWNGLDYDIKNKLNDYNAKYIDGSFGGIYNTLLSVDSFLLGHDCSNISAGNRNKIGYICGLAQAKEIYKNLAKNETIAIITHSMGAAAAKGFVKALIEYANKHGFDPKIILELDIAPFEWWDQKGHDDVPTYTISHWFDGVAGPSFMKNAKNFRRHFNLKEIHPFDEHSIDSFKDDAIDVLDGIIEGMKSGKIKVYLDGKRMN